MKNIFIAILLIGVCLFATDHIIQANYSKYLETDMENVQTSLQELDEFGIEVKSGFDILKMMRAANLGMHLFLLPTCFMLYKSEGDPSSLYGAFFFLSTYIIYIYFELICFENAMKIAGEIMGI